jgi:hypothetical protein
MIFEAFRQLCRFKQWVGTWVYSDEELYYSRNIVKQLIYPHTEVTWKATVPENVILLEELTREVHGTISRKCKVWYSGDQYSKPSSDEIAVLFETPIKTPWLWIGGHTFDGTVEKTSELQEFIVAGNMITLDLLSQIDNKIHTWIYLCPETFQQLEFPPKGIVILKDDTSRVENSEKEM